MPTSSSPRTTTQPAGLPCPVTALWLDTPWSPGGAVSVPSLLFPSMLGADNKPMGYHLVLTATDLQGFIGAQLLRTTDLPVPCTPDVDLVASASAWASAFAPFPLDLQAWRAALSAGPSAVLDLLTSRRVDSPAGLPIGQGAGPVVLSVGGLATNILLRSAFIQLGAPVVPQDSSLVLSELDKFPRFIAGGVAASAALLVEDAQSMVPVLRARYERAALLGGDDAPPSASSRPRRL